MTFTVKNSTKLLEYERCKSRVAKVNWDFPRVRLRTEPYSINGIHSLHWYPGRCIPHVAHELISIFSKPRETVLDPFAGSGTVVVEAVRLGRLAIGTDVNPIACLISRAKTALICPDDLRSYVASLKTKILEDMVQVARAKNSGRHRYMAHITRSIPNLEENQAWYHRETLMQLGIVYKHIQAEPDSRLRDFSLACFSHVLKDCSSQQNHWGYVCDNVKPNELLPKDAAGIFVREVTHMLDATTRYYGNVLNSKKWNVGLEEHGCEVFRVDARELSSKVQSGSVDLIVTSPPYPSVHDYINSQRLSFLWFEGQDFDRESLRRREIGARWKRSRPDSLSSFQEEICECGRQMHMTLKAGRYLCLILGESRSRVSQESFVLDSMQRIGFRLRDRIVRRISKCRNLVPSIIDEDICILQKT